MDSGNKPRFSGCFGALQPASPLSEAAARNLFFWICSQSWSIFQLKETRKEKEPRIKCSVKR